MPGGEIDDIEDIISKDDITPAERYNSRKMVVPKSVRVKKADSEVVSDSVIPGTQKVYVRTWGCSHNNSDGEYMAGQLGAYGYQIIGEPSDQVLND